MISSRGFYYCVDLGFGDFMLFRLITKSVFLGILFIRFFTTSQLGNRSTQIFCVFYVFLITLV